MSFCCWDKLGFIFELHQCEYCFCAGCRVNSFFGIFCILNDFSWLISSFDKSRVSFWLISVQIYSHICIDYMNEATTISELSWKHLVAKTWDQKSSPQPETELVAALELRTLAHTSSGSAWRGLEAKVPCLEASLEQPGSATASDWIVVFSWSSWQYNQYDNRNQGEWI